MSEKRQTCRYCDSTDVSPLDLPGGAVPVCELHRAHLEQRARQELDRMSGLPVHNDQPFAKSGDGTEPAGKPAADF